MALTRATALPPELGDAIRRRREQLGLTRLQLSLRLGWGPGVRTGWSPRTLVRIENGERPLGHRGELFHLAGALELSEEDLLGAADAPPEGPIGGGGRAPGRGAADAAVADALRALLAEQQEQTALLRRLAETLETGRPLRAGE